jgi:hypothetical protein
MAFTLARHQLDVAGAEAAQQVAGRLRIELRIPRLDRQEEAVVASRDRSAPSTNSGW